MSAQSTGVLEILDLEFVEEGMKGTRQRITSPPGEWLEVALPSRRVPDGLDSDRRGVVHFRQAAGVSAVTRAIKLGVSGESSSGVRYCWAEVSSSGAQLAAAILPKGFALAEAEPAPVASRIVGERLVAYWAPDGNPISIGLERFPGDLRSTAKRLNRASPTRGKVPDLPGILPVRQQRPIGRFVLAAAAAVLFILWVADAIKPDRPVPDRGARPTPSELSILSDDYATSYALIVGINRYSSPGWPDLSYAKKDAQGMAEFLQKRGFRVKTLLDAKATRTEIVRYLENELAPQLSSNDRLLFFFAGHGHTRVLNNEQYGYLVPHGADGVASYISMGKLRELSAKMGKAKHQLYILDACFGGLVGTKSGQVDEQRPDYIDVIMRRQARQVLTAGGKDQQVVDGLGPRGYGAFTGHLLEALHQGLADVDGDGFVTFSELTSYVIPRATNDYQTPGYSTLPGHGLGEFVFRVPAPADSGDAP